MSQEVATAMREYLGKQDDGARALALWEAFRKRCNAPGNMVDRANLLSEAASSLGFHATGPLVDYQRTDSYVEAELDALLWEWSRRGLVVPEFGEAKTGRPSAIRRVRLTALGSRVLDDKLPHPLSKNFLAAARKLPKEVQARLEDAASCLANDLRRPAVVAVGLAYETVVLGVAKLVLAKLPEMHRQRLTKLKYAAEKALGAVKGKKKSTVLNALDGLLAATAVAEHRNRAAHPGPDKFDYHTVEELVWRAPVWLDRLRKLPSVATP